MKPVASDALFIGMRVLIAFDKFKDAIDAPTACAAAAAGVKAARPPWELDLCPLADGGEGFSAILTRSVGGELRQVDVMGPLGHRQSAHFGLVHWRDIPAAARALLAPANGASDLTPGDRVAVVEMAVASGLAQVPNALRNPWKTTSYGTGELLRAAAAAGARLIVTGVGGSATNDLGLGTLAALGWSFLDSQGQQIGMPVPETWSRIARAVPPSASPLPRVAIACDVENPLLGARGATATYGPQKGLQAVDMEKLDGAMATMAQRLAAASGRPSAMVNDAGTGAAGGIVFGLRCAAQATTVPGFDLVQAWLDLERRIADTDLVLTGEGRFDDTSLSGKGPGALARRALALGKRVHVFAGSVKVSDLPAGMKANAITPGGMPLAEALKSTRALLETSVASVAGGW